MINLSKRILNVYSSNNSFKMHEKETDRTKGNRKSAIIVDFKNPSSVRNGEKTFGGTSAKMA